MSAQFQNFLDIVRRPFAVALLWLLEPVLSPMLEELDQNIGLLIIRKIDIADLVKGEDGSMHIRRDEAVIRRNYSRKV